MIDDGVVSCLPSRLCAFVPSLSSPPQQTSAQRTPSTDVRSPRTEPKAMIFRQYQRLSADGGCIRLVSREGTKEGRHEGGKARRREGTKERRDDSGGCLPGTRAVLGSPSPSSAGLNGARSALSSSPFDAPPLSSDPTSSFVPSCLCAFPLFSSPADLCPANPVHECQIAPH